jgi:hypothetical protein
MPTSNFDQKARESAELSAKLIFEPQGRDPSVPEITHSEFLTGLKDKTVAYHVIDPTFVIRGIRKKILAVTIMLYWFAPLIFGPLFALVWHNWLYLLGTVTSYMGTFIIARWSKKSLSSVVFVSAIFAWWFEGFHSIPTFLLLCAVWGDLIIEIANGAEAEYASQALAEDPELYRQAIANNRVNVWRWTDLSNKVAAAMKARETENSENTQTAVHQA